MSIGAYTGSSAFQEAYREQQRQMQERQAALLSELNNAKPGQVIRVDQFPKFERMPDGRVFIEAPEPDYAVKESTHWGWWLAVAVMTLACIWVWWP